MAGSDEMDNLPSHQGGDSHRMQHHQSTETCWTWPLLSIKPDVSPQTVTTPIPPIISLPLEIKGAILGSLPDVTSLRTAILTCRAFYSAYAKAESFLLGDVLGQEIPSELILDALAAHDASTLGETTLTWSPDKVAKIMSRYDGNCNASLARRWRLEDAWSLSYLHKTVQILSLELFDAAIRWSEEDKSTTPKLPSYKPTSSEIQRIERSFYRYDMYCNFFRARSPSTMAPRVSFEPFNQHLLFFQRFPAWEIEQLACVHEFLSDILETCKSPAFT